MFDPPENDTMSDKPLALPQDDKIEEILMEAPMSIESELALAKQEAAEYKDKYLRNLAEMENSRKRLQKEKLDLTQYAIQNVILDFLPPLDHLENALRFTEQASPEVKHWATGFEMILTQFKDALANNGITTIVSVGTPFDHDSHEAVEMVATDLHLEGTVVEEHVRGYKMGDRVIRPARVKVAKSITTEGLEENNNFNQQ